MSDEKWILIPPSWLMQFIKTPWSRFYLGLYKKRPTFCCPKSILFHDNPCLFDLKKEPWYDIMHFGILHHAMDDLVIFAILVGS